jgi:hypothetical protein
VTARTIHLLDLAVVAWVVLWVGLGVVSFFEVRGLASLSDTMQVAGESLQEAGDGLGAVASIPLVGGGIRAAADRVQDLATQTIEEADASRTHITRLSVLALLVGGVVPVLMAVCVWLPLRRHLTRRGTAAG